MRNMDISRECAFAFVIQDRKGNYYWKEWNFYANYPLFEKAAALLLDNISSHTRATDCVISLSKSGFPLAAWLALKLGKPLFLFSIGELFHPNGTSVIGIYPEGEIPYRRPLIVDSHVNTGGTYRLLSKVCCDAFDEKIFAVLIDVRNSNAFQIEDPVFSLYSRRDIWPALLELEGVDEKRLETTEFWMREEDYWLSEIEDIPLEGERGDRISFEQIGDAVLTRKVKDGLAVSFLDTWESVAPLKLYQDPPLFVQVLDLLQKRLNRLDIDTIVACSLSAVPLAIALCVRSGDVGTEIRRFIFLGNGTKRFYECLFDGCRNVLLCDDMVASGGLLYRIYDEFIRDERSLMGVVAIFNQNESLDRKYLAALPIDATYLALRR